MASLTLKTADGENTNDAKNTIVGGGTTGETKAATGETPSSVVRFSSFNFFNLNTLPPFMRRQIFHFLTMKEYSLNIRLTCQDMNKDYIYVLKHHSYTKECIYVPRRDGVTLNTAYRRVDKSNGVLTTIVLDEGEHIVDEYEDDYYDKVNYLHIKCPVHIRGSLDALDKSKIIVVGGFWIERNVNGTVHLENLTIRQSTGCGVYGKSSFTLNDISIEQCGFSGVRASGPSVVGRCTNIIVRQCGESGVVAHDEISSILHPFLDGASIILDGTETSIHDNCTKGESNNYGLNVYGSSSKIQINLPLTKDSISKRNGGGGNYNSLVK